MRPCWSDVVHGGWLTGLKQLHVSLTHCWQRLSTCHLQPWGSYLDAHFSRSNGSPCCPCKQWRTFSPLQLHSTPHFCWQHQNLRASYRMVDKSLLLRLELAWLGVNEREWVCPVGLCGDMFIWCWGLLQGPCMYTHRLSGKGQSACLRAFSTLCLTFFVIFCINRWLYMWLHVIWKILFVCFLVSMHTFTQSNFCVLGFNEYSQSNSGHFSGAWCNIPSHPVVRPLIAKGC